VIDFRGVAVVAVGAAALEVGRHVHDVAGPAGDIGVICATGAVVGAILRRVWRRMSQAWDSVEATRRAVEEIPAFMVDQRKTNAVVEKTMVEHGKALDVLAARERDLMVEALHASRHPMP
jgi:hypothetical protein